MPRRNECQSVSRELCSFDVHRLYITQTYTHCSFYSHGGDGNWRSLARGLTGGYSQVEVTVDSYLDKKSFSLIPNLPPSPFKASGQEGENAIKTTLILINHISLEHALTNSIDIYLHFITWL